ncbi:MAG TPA: hypothetical protein VK174_04020 [Chitinophagales bacterium]|nr:hypothetical protein [Chitinophagales bacterium]
MKQFILSVLFVAFTSLAFAQADSTTIKQTQRSSYSGRDSLYLKRLNNSGNLMIAGGIGLCGIGGYLIYQGNKIYTTVPETTDPAVRQGEIDRNHKQGTIYYAIGGVAIAGGIVLVAIGAKNKVEFKQRKRMMELQSGILDNGHLGLALTF